MPCKSPLAEKHVRLHLKFICVGVSSFFSCIYSTAFRGEGHETSTHNFAFSKCASHKPVHATCRENESCDGGSSKTKGGANLSRIVPLLEKPGEERTLEDIVAITDELRLVLCPCFLRYILVKKMTAAACLKSISRSQLILSWMPADVLQVC
jgi:hypothetical protein